MGKDVIVNVVMAQQANTSLVGKISDTQRNRNTLDSRGVIIP